MNFLQSAQKIPSTFLWNDKQIQLILHNGYGSKWLKSFLPFREGEKKKQRWTRDPGLTVKSHSVLIERIRCPGRSQEQLLSCRPWRKPTRFTCFLHAGWHIILSDLEAPGIHSAWNWDLHTINSLGQGSIYQIQGSLSVESCGKFSLGTDLLNILISST